MPQWNEQYAREYNEYMRNHNRNQRIKMHIKNGLAGVLITCCFIAVMVVW